MTRINTNVAAIIAQNNLASSNQALQTSLERLSTGLAINTAADNPAGYIISQSLASEIAGINTAITNAQTASNVIGTANSALTQVSNLLTSIKGLAVEAANTGAFSPAEIQANQLQIDSAVASITRISNTTSFGGLQLLNGSLSYVVSGVNSNAIQNVQINQANFGTHATIPVTVDVLNSAQHASLFLSSFSASTTSGQLLSSVSIEVTGSAGVQVFSFVSGTHLSAVAFAVNQVSDSTGVTASLVSGSNQTSGLVLQSTAFGSSAFVSVSKLSGGANFTTYNQKGGSAVQRENGQDVLALVNGSLALGNGTQISLNSNTVDLSLNLTDKAAQTLGNYSFTITGGGANFQIGAEVNSSEQVGFGIQSVAASDLGNDTVGFLSSIASGGANSLVSGNAANASKIIDAAIAQISELGGRLGAFESNTLNTTVDSQQIALENLTSAQSSITDTDFAVETSNLSRAQILVSAGTSVLALANNDSQNVLKLLGGQ